MASSHRVAVMRMPRLPGVEGRRRVTPAVGAQDLNTVPPRGAKLVLHTRRSFVSLILVFFLYFSGSPENQKDSYTKKNE